MEYLDAVNNPEDPAAGSRKIPFSRELWIEATDFLADPPKGYYRLAPGREVRLRYGYFIRCEEAVYDEQGNVTELRCTYDPATRGGAAPAGRKVKGTIHWLAAAAATPVEVRMYDRLFSVEQPGTGDVDFLEELNPDSLKIVTALAEDAVVAMKPGECCQFERQGYFCCDPDSTPERRVFNCTVTLKDSWSKVCEKEKR